jgi:DnaK suppressor protein
MDEDRARALLTAKRNELQELLAGTESDSEQDKEAQGDTGDIADPAQLLTAQGEDDAISESLRGRLAALERAEERLANGTYGKSVRSGLAIPDARLEADPTAELTIEEAREDPEVH